MKPSLDEVLEFVNRVQEAEIVSMDEETNDLDVLTVPIEEASE